ncbi:2-phosphosulfolactate phosphatase [Glaciibacter sp. 2TAF33]|uniref:2-phosphosulfolactate phosphatase n=1 Tax=Glaciibacter sp. 2TAF33 TaxID=3233015 RepID=UPI003F90FE0D
MSETQPQGTYQVRFDWGVAGFQALASGADVVVLADALPPAGSPDAAALVRRPLSGHRVIRADLGNRTAVAEWVMARQTETGARFSVAVIAIGERRQDGSARWGMEDLLVAGAVVDALTELGIDHCSPEAAAASAAFVGLKRALRHLLAASETGLALAAAGQRDVVSASTVLDHSRDVPEVGEFAFPA